MIDIEKTLKAIDKYFNSDQFRKSQKHLQKLSARNNKYLRSLTIEQRSTLIEKIVNKYESDEYNLREHKKGYEPRTSLYSVLLNYAAAYCRPSLYKVNEYFEEQQWDIDGRWIISIIYGQGSFIKLTKLKEGEIVPHYEEERDEIEIYYPTGELIIKTSNPYIINDVLGQIKGKQGFYTIRNGIKEEIFDRQIKVPEKVKWEIYTYYYLGCKQNILLYTRDGDPQLGDHNAEILVIQLRKDRFPKDAFYVLFYISINCNHSIIMENISKNTNRIAIPIYE